MCTDPVVHGASFPRDALIDHVHLDPVPAAVGLARSFVADRAERVADDARDVLMLLTSELVTNAILHARTPLQLGVVLDETRLLVAVADRAPGESTLEPLDWSKDRPGGRGLALVAALASEWGSQTTAHGKSVWFVLSLARATELQGQRAG